jgi:DNA polymerase (family 10)
MANRHGLDRDAIVDTLELTGKALEILGENPFKVRAYAGAARALDTLEGDLDRLIAADELPGVKGIGKGLAEKIGHLRLVGNDAEIDAVMARVPDGIFEMLAIPGFGPKKAKTVWETLDITAVGQLEYACNENRLVELPGFGAKTQENILAGIRNLKKYQGRRLRPKVEEEALALLTSLREEPTVVRVELAGSFRRKMETVKDIDLVASSDDPEAVMARFVSADRVEEIIGSGRTKSSVRLVSGLPVDLRVVADAAFPHALHHFTGSKNHNIELRALAHKQGLKLNEYGLWRGDETIVCADEADIYAALGLAFIPPELREGGGEIELARTNRHPWAGLIEPGDLTGVFHCHTVASDGKNTLREMAEAARDMGYAYLGLSDHSQSAHYAGGLTADDLRRQADEVAAVAEAMPGFTVFHGVESDIVADGRLDYPDDVLARLDFVIASIHSGFTADEKKMTDRVIAATRRPATTMLGHMTGRLLLSREGYPLDVAKVIEACAENNVIIELNANPHRLDIDWRHLRAAVAAGVTIAINPDAHRIAGLAHAVYGVMAARKGGLTKENVLNAWPVEKVAARLREKK